MAKLTKYFVANEQTGNILFKTDFPETLAYINRVMARRKKGRILFIDTEEKKIVGVKERQGVEGKRVSWKSLPAGMIGNGMCFIASIARYGQQDTEYQKILKEVLSK